MHSAKLKRVLVYGAALAAGTLALAWLDYQSVARARSDEIYVVLVAAGFLALGAWFGARAWRRGETPAFDGNPKAVASLGISAREMAVLGLLAAGGSNKGIARQLGVSPNTVKTHVARLYEKLAAKRRTEAIARARELGILR